LRQTWHPDLASDPSEKEIREQRMKQINAAWEILANKRAQA
jgi:DnaJ-class molecular chaperone